jgi:hypothetical protein
MLAPRNAPKWKVLRGRPRKNDSVISVRRIAIMACDKLTEFQIDQSYYLRYRLRADSNVSIALDYALNESRVLRAKQFNK